MIISASRRTDIPALYPEWFMNRLRAREVLVPNPYNRKKISRITLSPDTVDCLVFWTKNPEPILPYLEEIDSMGYKYYFQVTITDYGNDIEVNAPDMSDVMASFILMSEMIGKNKMDWRFDPILLNDKYTIEYHLEKFEMMCRWLHKSTTRCITSFVDSYKGSIYPELKKKEIEKLAEGMSRIAESYKFPLYTCAEKMDLSKYGIQHASCIDKNKIHKLIGYKVDLKKDAGQRKECGCIESTDIGMYESCTHGCKYCYANASVESAQKKHALHDPESPMLIGNLKGDETILDKECISSRDNQISLFDLPEMGFHF